MSSQEETISSQRDGAEIYHGGNECKKKAKDFLASINLPTGLLPLDDMTEIGYNRTTGYLWLKMNNKVHHRFKAVRTDLSYNSEVTAFLENRRMHKITGIMIKELLLWLDVVEFAMDNNYPDTINFTTRMGLSESFPAEYFEQD